VADTAKARRRGNSARRAEETRWCLEQRLKSRSYPEIARASATEFGRKLSQTAVFRRVQDGIEGLVKEPAEQVRAMELARLDEMESAVRQVRDKRHVHVSGGKIVLGSDGEPLIDDGPVLSATDRLLKIHERRARLWGIDAPVQGQTEMTVRYEVVGVNIAQLT
jgi:hypothetical protein